MGTGTPSPSLMIISLFIHELLVMTYPVYRMGQKNCTPNSWPYFCQILTDFSSSIICATFQDFRNSSMYSFMLNCLVNCLIQILTRCIKQSSIFDKILSWSNHTYPYHDRTRKYHSSEACEGHAHPRGSGEVDDPGFLVKPKLQRTRPSCSVPAELQCSIL